MSQPKRWNKRLPQISYGMEESQDGEYVLYSDYAALAAENEVLRKKADWLQKADRLVVWNGTKWQVRHELNGDTKTSK